MVEAQEAEDSLLTVLTSLDSDTQTQGENKKNEKRKTSHEGCMQYFVMLFYLTKARGPWAAGRSARLEKDWVL